MMANIVGALVSVLAFSAFVWIVGRAALHTARACEMYDRFSKD